MSVHINVSCWGMIIIIYILHFIPVHLFEMWDMAFKCQISIICQMVDIANGALILRFLRSFFYFSFFFFNIFVSGHSFTGILMKHIICASFKTLDTRWPCLWFPLKTLEKGSLNFHVKKKAKSKTQNTKPKGSWGSPSPQTPASYLYLAVAARCSNHQSMFFGP